MPKKVTIGNRKVLRVMGGGVGLLVSSACPKTQKARACAAATISILRKAESHSAPYFRNESLKCKVIRRNRASGLVLCECAHVRIHVVGKYVRIVAARHAGRHAGRLMYTYMYVHMYVCKKYIERERDVRMRVHVCVYVCMYVCINMNIDIHIYVYVYMCVRFIYACTYYIYIYIYMHIYT